MTRTSSLWLWFGLVLLMALIGRVLLLVSGAVSFHSDEAVVALMARHILQGERPVFFFGQAYMGSLDAWLVAAGFRLFGETVTAIRLVQSALYLLVVASGYAVAWRLSGRLVVAVVTGLTLTIAPVLVATYTTATLGGYNETLLLGNLLLLLTYDVTHDHPRSWWRWALLGVCAGLGWWTNGLIVAYALPVGLLILKRIVEAFFPHRTGQPSAALSRPSLRGRGEVEAEPAFQAAANNARRPLLMGIVIAAVGFFVGSAPWWGFAFANDFAPLRFYIGSASGSFAGNDAISLPLGERLVGLFFLGLPALIGMRFPWTSVYFAPWLGAVVLVIYGVALYRLIRYPRLPSGTPILKPDARLMVLSMIGLFCGLFLVSRFSSDPTGRYFLPLVLPLGIVLGTLIAALRRPLVQAALVAVVLGYFAAGQVSAITNPPGLTTQFNLVTHIPNEHDEALIAFLDEHNLVHGYTNYWVSFRLAFLSGERLQYSAALPYKSDLTYTPLDERYPPYRTATDAAERVAYITANVPEVEAELIALFADAGVTYDTAQVGAYTVYYDFTPAAQTPRPPFAFSR